MRFVSKPLLTGLSVLVSFSLWIGGISWLLVKVFALSPDTGWIVAGSLSALAVVLVSVFAYEVRHAIDLPDDYDFKPIKDFSMGDSRLKFRSVAPLPVNPAPAFRAMGKRF